MSHNTEFAPSNLETRQTPTEATSQLGFEKAKQSLLTLIANPQEDQSQYIRLPETGAVGVEAILAGVLSLELAPKDLESLRLEATNPNQPKTILDALMSRDLIRLINNNKTQEAFTIRLSSNPNESPKIIAQNRSTPFNQMAQFGRALELPLPIWNAIQQTYSAKLEAERIKNQAAFVQYDVDSPEVLGQEPIIDLVDLINTIALKYSQSHRDAFRPFYGIEYEMLLRNISDDDFLKLKAQTELCKMIDSTDPVAPYRLQYHKVLDNKNTRQKFIDYFKTLITISSDNPIKIKELTSLIDNQRELLNTCFIQFVNNSVFLKLAAIDYTE